MAFLECSGCILECAVSDVLPCTELPAELEVTDTLRLDRFHGTRMVTRPVLNLVDALRVGVHDTEMRHGCDLLSVKVYWLLADCNFKYVGHGCCRRLRHWGALLSAQQGS